MPRHVTDLHSAAYDGALTQEERRRYDAHLAGCADCRATAAELRQAVDALRALPAAQMPHRVVLPATPPQPERGRPRIAWPQRIPRPQLTPAWGAAALTVAGLAIAIVAVRGHAGGGSVESSSALRAPSVLDTGGGSAARPVVPTAGIGTCPLPVAVVPQPSGASAEPQGFANSTRVTTPQRPSQQLTLATTASKVAPGERVLVFAALTSSSSAGGATAVVPCVTLHDQGATALAPASSAAADSAASTGKGPTPPAGPAGTSVPAPGAAELVPAPNTLLNGAQVQAFAPYALLPSLAVASPTAGALAGLPLQVLQIPANVAPGTVLQVVALVPSGLPGSADQPAVEAVLTLVVS